ncbi:MAG: sensor histidine kinase [Trueperaceae bacterium]|nr:sensor histidine kinase [Trueperaceae bacterium]
MTDADLRLRELETLHELAHTIANSLEPRETLEQTLKVLIDTGWFSCGEAFLKLEGMLETVAVGLCGYQNIEACQVRPKLLRDAERVMTGNKLTQVNHWQLIPVDNMAVIALSGGNASSPFFEALIDIIRAALKRARLHWRLSEKEIQRSKLLQALLRAQEEERGRISRDLHDQVGQALTGILLGLDAAINHPEDANLAQLKELASITLGDVRRIALDLRPSVLDALGLEAALKRYTREITERYNIQIEILVSVPKRLNPDEETVLYRVAQEALTNIVRHAKAKQASIVLTTTSKWVQLVIEDNGIGFKLEELLAAERIGLTGMRERVELFNGNLSIESSPGKGTSVHARLPLRT